MSFIEKHHLNYLVYVEQFFLSLKGSGLSLSANDYHLISDWERREYRSKSFVLQLKRVRSSIINPPNLEEYLCPT